MRKRVAIFLGRVYMRVFKTLPIRDKYEVTRAIEK
jgi:hypothetical protein